MKPKSRAMPGAADMLYKKMLRCLANGGDPKQKYSPMKLIDSGTFSHVVLASVKTSACKSLVAIKIMKVEKQPYTMLANELTIMKKIRHANVVSAIDTIYVEAVNKVWLVMEYMKGCSLTKIVRNAPLREPQIRYIASQCINGICYLHKENIVHRDIKSNNVLVDVRGRVKITDFGTSYIYNRLDKKADIVGSPCWMAPEVVARRPYDFKIDIWSFGITLVEMLENDPPYINEETTNIIKLVKGIGKPFFKTYFKLSKELKSFIDSCLVVDSNKRASARELKEHEFLDSDMDVVTASFVKK